MSTAPPKELYEADFFAWTQVQARELRRLGRTRPNAALDCAHLAEEIADFLNKANPNWPRAALVEMMNKHLSTTADEVVARLTKNWDADIRAYDAVYEHILAMADALSDGIVKQFPAKFSNE